MAIRNILEIITAILMVILTILGILKVLAIIAVIWFIVQSLAYSTVISVYNHNQYSDNIEKGKWTSASIILACIPVLRHIILIDSIKSDKLKILGAGIDKNYFKYIPVISAVIIMCATWRYKIIGVLIRVITMYMCYKHIYSEMEHKSEISCIPVSIVSCLIGIIPVVKFFRYRTNNKLGENDVYI